MNINQDLLLDDSQYVKEEHKKDLIVLHHTVGGSAKSTIDYWKGQPERIATAFVVERDGTIYQAFNPKYWAYHLGIKGTNALDKRSIGIELASEGGLTQHGAGLYCFGVVSPRTVFTKKTYDNKTPWRGYQYFDAYDDPQIDATIELVNYLCNTFNIPKNFVDNLFEYKPEYLNHKGILAHCNVRADKSDVHPGFPMDRLR